jgi:hypothetical protein
MAEDKEASVRKIVIDFKEYKYLKDIEKKYLENEQKLKDSYQIPNQQKGFGDKHALVDEVVQTVLKKLNAGTSAAISQPSAAYELGTLQGIR